MQKVFSFVSLRITLMTRSLPMPLYEERRLTRPIHIHLTSEYLVVIVKPDKLRNGSFTHSSWVREWRSLLQFLNAQYPTLNKHLIVFSSATRDLDTSKRQLSHRMRKTASSLGWMVERYQYRERLSE